jgi:transcriptional regulator with XRE-family HTH domain
MEGIGKGAKLMADAAATVGSALRGARERRGWNREELAYHSGVSWSAIAQIEAGRRRDIRLSSLSALAAALGVSLDQVAGIAAPVARGLEHNALVYASDDELVRGALPFMTEGLDRKERVLVVTTKSSIEVLRDALGERAADVEFRDAPLWYPSPQAALAGYQALFDESEAAGVLRTRIVGELVLDGLSSAETHVWMRYESLVNVLFARAEVSYICLYDSRSLPPDVLADAIHTHPEAIDSDGSRANPLYRRPEDFLLQPTS